MLISFICASAMPYVVNLSINAVYPFLAVVGAHMPDIATVDLQSDKYLQYSVFQLLVNIVGSYLENSASKIGVVVPHSS
jgi:hypothetical protein